METVCLRADSVLRISQFAVRFKTHTKWGKEIRNSSTGKEKKMLQKNKPTELNRQKPHPRKSAYLWAFMGMQFSRHHLTQKRKQNIIENVKDLS